MNIYEKLFNAKKEIGKISKDSTNPFFKSKYFDINALLEHVEPILQKHGLVLLQPLMDDKVVTAIFNIEDASEFIESEIKLPAITDPQKLGSAITYFRRYTLQSLLALQAEDDDGNKASQPVKKTYVKNDLPWLNEGSSEWKTICLAIDKGQLSDLEQITKFKYSKATKEALLKLMKL